MNVEEFRNHCLKKEGVTEEFPFDEETLVYKVFGKMFALANLESFESINLKCDPEKALELREEFEGVLPGYHMNKRHWNTVRTEAGIPDNLLFGWIDDSYELVLSKVPKSKRARIK
jgi:predicted DNA-binding protein (MmcQ/YjbR family)